MHVPRELLFTVFRFVLATYILLCAANVRPTVCPWAGKIAGDDWPN